MSYTDYQKFRVIDAAQIILDYLNEVDASDLGLVNYEKADLKYMLVAMQTKLLKG